MTNGLRGLNKSLATAMSELSAANKSVMENATRHAANLTVEATERQRSVCAWYMEHYWSVPLRWLGSGLSCLFFTLLPEVVSPAGGPPRGVVPSHKNQ